MLIKKSMLSDRIYEVLHTDINDKRYNKLTQKSIETNDKLKALILEGKEKEFNAVEDEIYDIQNQKHNIVLVKTYKQGFTDGLDIVLLLLKQKK